MFSSLNKSKYSLASSHSWYILVIIIQLGLLTLLIETPWFIKHRYNIPVSDHQAAVHPLHNASSSMKAGRQAQTVSVVTSLAILIVCQSLLDPFVHPHYLDWLILVSGSLGMHHPLRLEAFGSRILLASGHAQNPWSRQWICADPQNAESFAQSPTKKTMNACHAIRGYKKGIEK